MSIDNFKKQPEETKWFPLFQFFEDKPYGYLATYEEIATATGIDLRVDRNALYAAQKRLLVDRQRALDCERGVGYRVAQPVDHLALARERRKRSWRQLDKGKKLLAYPNRTRLSHEQRQEFDKQLIIFSRLYDGVRRPKISGIEFQPKFSLEAAKKADSEARRTRVASLGGEITEQVATGD